MTKENFIKQFGERALSRYKSEKILPSLVICQAILETGWGTTDKAVSLNNYHGIKWYNDSVCKPYRAVNCKTWEEYTVGTITDITALFCAFDSIDQELDCYYSWLRRPKQAYTDLHGCMDALKCFELIKQAGYATDSQYTAKLTRIYNENPLIAEYDRKAINIVKGCDEYLRVQIGSFIDFDRAVRYAKEASEKLKMSVCIKKYGEYHRVQLGAFTQKTNAESCKQRAVNAGYKTAYITSECGEDVYYQTYPA